MSKVKFNINETMRRENARKNKRMHQTQEIRVEIETEYEIERSIMEREIVNDYCTKYSFRVQ